MGCVLISDWFLLPRQGLQIPELRSEILVQGLDLAWVRSGISKVSSGISIKWSSPALGKMEKELRLFIPASQGTQGQTQSWGLRLIYIVSHYGRLLD